MLKLELLDANGVARSVHSRGELVRYAAWQSTSCVHRDNVLKYMQKYNWRYEETGDTIWVDVRPPLPFAKEPGAVFAFDKDNCWREY